MEENNKLLSSISEGIKQNHVLLEQVIALLSK